MQDTAVNWHHDLVRCGFYSPHKDDLLNYWKLPNDEFNRAEGYFSPGSRSELLGSLIKAHCPLVQSALELGCNVGRNLNYLQMNLGLSTGGLEISSHALSLLKEHYPEINKSQLFLGDLTQVITEIDDNSFDLVFSMAVLMHIPPQVDESFWSHIPRVAAKHIITIENEDTGSHRNWARNYADIFLRLGVQEIHAETVSDITGLQGYTARVFSK